MYCTNCGDFIASDENFCGKCGMPAPDCDEVDIKGGKSKIKSIAKLVAIVVAVGSLAALVILGYGKFSEIKKNISCKFLK